MNLLKIFNNPLKDKKGHFYGFAKGSEYMGYTGAVKKLARKAASIICLENPSIADIINSDLNAEEITYITLNFIDQNNYLLKCKKNFKGAVLNLLVDKYLNEVRDKKIRNKINSNDFCKSIYA